MADYSQYQHLLVEKHDGIALVTMNRPEKLNAANAVMHRELGRIWIDLGEDTEVRAVIVTGAGKAFSSGGDFEVSEQNMLDPEYNFNTLKEARDVVNNLVELDKPVVSAINGVAVGAGMAVAVLADISIASEQARFNDGHVRFGVAAGDHACLIWPLLCGMAKAKYYLLTGEFLEAREAERIGMVSMVVPHEELMSTAWKVARQLADGPQIAIRFTKRALNQWIRQASITSFDYSLALEMLSFFGADPREGLKAVKEKRQPLFPSAQG